MVRGSTVARIIALMVLGAGAAAISNLTASTERKLAWIGSYPRALEIGSREATPVAATPTIAPVSPAPSTPGPAPGGVTEMNVSKTFPPHPDKASVEIEPADVELLYGRKALFLDARRSSVYAEGHIAGARNLPVWESDIDARVKSLYEEGLDQRAPIVVYCSGGDCEDSHMLAEKLYMVGFDNILIYKDGFPDWQKRGLPVIRGANP